MEEFRDHGTTSRPRPHRRPQPGFLPRRRGGPGRHRRRPARRPAAARRAEQHPATRRARAGPGLPAAAARGARAARRMGDRPDRNGPRRRAPAGPTSPTPSASPAARPPNAATCASAPAPAGTTGEQRVQATRDDRAADRTVTAWARNNAADLRRLAGQITALTDLPAARPRPARHLDAALADDDPADLIAPLTATRPHLTTDHPDLAARSTPSPTLNPPVPALCFVAARAPGCWRMPRSALAVAAAGGSGRACLTELVLNGRVGFVRHAFSNPGRPRERQSGPSAVIRRGPSGDGGCEIGRRGRPEALMALDLAQR